MAGAATADNSIVINIETKIQGYQAEIEKIKQSLAKIGTNAQIGKNITRELAAVEKQVDALSKRMTQRISSDSQLTKLGDSLQNVEERFVHIGEQVQQISFRDLDTGYVTSQLQNLVSAAEAAEQQLRVTLDTGFQAIVNRNPNFKNLVENYLNLDFNNLNIDNFTQVLGPAIDEAIQKTRALGIEVSNLKRESTTLGTSIANTAREIQNLGNIDLDRDVQKRLNLDNAMVFSTQKSTDLQNAIIDGFNRSISTLNISDATKQLATQKILEAFISNDPATIQAAVHSLARNIRDIVTKEAKGYQIGDFNFGVKQAIAASSNTELQSTFGSYNTLANLASSNNFQPFLKEKDVQLVQDFETNVAKLFQRFNNFGKEASEVPAIIQKFTDALLAGGKRDAYAEITKVIQEYLQVLQQAEQANRARKTQVDTELGTKEPEYVRRRRNDQSLAMSLQRDTNDIAALRQRAAPEAQAAQQSRAAADAAQQQLVNEERQKGADLVRQYNEALQETNSLIAMYQNQLDQVREKQRIVGKLEGLAQRWFSAYAAIRMVRQAIDSVISTVKELDKTITEIAIVTDMTQKDLWGQMSSYTDMARQYAASISGVYEVSQLYYQQGLQTVDVMALTEETLKLARISGLDYADAANYMTNAVRSFKMEMTDAQRVTDVYSAIAAASATSVSELAVAMSKTASSAEAVNASFENTTAMMAVMIGNSVPCAA